VTPTVAELLIDLDEELALRNAVVAELRRFE
jgi:hypothetical protein